MNKIRVRLAVAATAIGSIVLISFPFVPSVRGIDFRPESLNRALKAERTWNNQNSFRHAHG